MHIRAGDGAGPGLGGAAKLVADRARSIAKLELQLATTELKKKAATLGFGIGLLVGAGILGLFGLAFALATIAAGLATVLDVWLALLVVTGSLVVLAGVLVVFGLALVRKGAPPVPEHALEEAKKTTEVLRNGR